MTYAVQEGTFRTPHGHSVVMAYRADSSDWNTLWSCLNEDEYGLRERPISGTALDVGAHIGGVTVGLAIDNPTLRVVAIEAVPPNVELLRQNVQRNGVADRVTVIAGAAGAGPVDVWYGYTGSEAAEHHAFIGNSSLAYAAAVGEHLTEHYDAGVTLSDLLPISFAKIDCEGCEYAFLADPGAAQVPLIVGEWHPVGGHAMADVLALLGQTHTLTFTGPEAGPGSFVAVAA